MKTPLLVFCLVLGLGTAIGCSKDDSAPSAETVKQADRLTQIQTKTGGDWDKLTPEDKNYLVNELSHGSESTAKMLLGPAKPAKPPGVGGR